MSDTWTFGPPADHTSTYADGTVVPSREWAVYLNGLKIGYAEVHMHKRRGRDAKTDVSFGVTAVVFGPPLGGN